METITLIPIDDIYEAQERMLKILAIETDVNLLRDMFFDLNSMIKMQNEPITIIVAQIEEVKDNVKVANDDLEKRSVYQHRNSSIIKYVLIFGAAIIVLVKLI
jgi:t-SNARE complex subunit (syntaxin)